MHYNKVPGGPLGKLLDPEAGRSVKPARVLFTNFLAAWLTAFMTTSINIALPSIQTEFRLGAVPLGWLPLGYVLVTAVLLLPFGRAADKHGRRMIFLTGLGCFAVSSLILVFVNSYVALLVFRLTQGLGSALMFSTSMAMVTLAYPPHKRGWAMGVSVAAAYLGQTTGPILGGVIVHNLGWRSLFLVTACFAFLLFALDLSLLGRAEWREKQAPGFDWTGTAIYGISIAAFLAGLSLVPQAVGLVLVGCGAVALVLFGFWETRVTDPLVPLRLLARNRVFTFSSLTALISYASVWATSYLMSLYLQFIKGLNPQTAGTLLIIGVALQCVMSPFGGRLSDRIQPRWIASFGMALCVVALCLFSFVRGDTPYWYIITALCILGLGYAFFSGPNQSAIMGSVDRRLVGFASAGISTFRMVGMAASIAIATLIMAQIVGRQDIQPQDYPALLTAIRITFALFTFLCLAGVFTSLVRGNLPRGEQLD
ncbi:MAG: MFS transporter [Thermoleophilia bacterium]|nr:MFS transporter [Thermoleophilia bacterium]